MPDILPSLRKFIIYDRDGNIVLRLRDFKLLILQGITEYGIFYLYRRYVSHITEERVNEICRLILFNLNHNKNIREDLINALMIVIAENYLKQNIGPDYTDVQYADFIEEYGGALMFELGHYLNVELKPNLCIYLRMFMRDNGVLISRIFGYLRDHLEMTGELNLNDNFDDDDDQPDIYV